jgi:hypothetical protein
MKRTHGLCLASFLVLFASAAAAEPFNSCWNWENAKVRGKVKSIHTTMPDDRTVEEFDKNGRKLKHNLLDADGKLVYETKLEYSGDGDLSRVVFGRAGAKEPMYTETAEYKEKGIIKAIYGVRGAAKYASHSFKYDDDKRLKSISMRRGNRLMHWTFKWDDKENLVESAIMYEDYKMAGSKYTNNEKGDPVRVEITRKGVSRKTTFSYKYDDKGNWTERTRTGSMTRGGEVVKGAPSKTTRKIVYWKD